MNKSIIKNGLILITFGLVFFANVATAQNGPDEYIEAKDMLRMMTYATHLRNSEIDEWKHITDLKALFDRDISAVRTNRILVQEVKAYCASATDSYTCNRDDLIISVDDKLSSAVREWENAVLNVIAIDKYRDGSATAPRFKQLREYNALMANIDRFNERGKVAYNLASHELVEFQELNPLLFVTLSD